MNNLKELRKKKGLTQKELAEYIGITQKGYANYESGAREPSIETLNMLADLFGVSVDTILGRAEIGHPAFRELKIEHELETEETMILPVVASLRCGFGKSGEPFTVVDKIPVPVSYKRYGESLVVVMAVGDSMLPTIPPGAFLICVPGEAWEDGHIVAVNVNDSDTVKRIYRAPNGGIRLVPDNPRYKEQSFSPEEVERLQIKVLGRVRKAISPDL